MSNQKTKYYRVIDSTGKTRFESLYKTDVEEFLKKKYEKNKEILNIEEILDK